MDIQKRLPFDCCENCGEFVLKCDQQTLWFGDGGSHLMLTVSCKNENQCRHLKLNLERMDKADADGT